MAGTPTPNYQFPTYAETDTPNLAGAYNQAVNAIDAKIKEVADSVSSGGDVPDATSTTKGIAKLYDSATVGAGDQDDGGITPKAVDDKIGGSLTGYAPKFTAAAPITYSGNQIGIRYSNPAADGAQNGYGAVQVTGKQSDVAEADSLTTATVPNVKAVKDYVDAKVPTEQQAYTGTAPVVVDNGSRTISVGNGTNIDYTDGAYTDGVPGVVYSMSSTATLNYFKTGTLPSIDGVLMPSLAGTRQWVLNRTPDASATVKGVVALNEAGTDGSNNTTAMTALGTVNLLKTMQKNTSQKITVQDLANNLYVSTSTGLVFYKAPTE